MSAPVPPPPADTAFEGTVCVWADGPDRAVDDYDGIRQDISRALLAPSAAVAVCSHECDGDTVTYTVRIEAPRTDVDDELAGQDVPW